MKIPEGWKLVPEEPTPEMVAAVFAGKMEDQSLTGQIRRRKAMADNYSAMLAAAPTPPAQEVEPVAYLAVRRTGTATEQSLLRPTDDIESYKYRGFGLAPLYTRPDNSGLRKAAEEALEVLEYFSVDHRLSRYTMERVERAESHLRAALEGK